MLSCFFLSETCIFLYCCCFAELSSHFRRMHFDFFGQKNKVVYGKLTCFLFLLFNRVYVAKIVDDGIVITHHCFSSKNGTMPTASKTFVYRVFLFNTKKPSKWLVVVIVDCCFVKWYFERVIIHPNRSYMIIIQKRKEVWKN